MVRPVLRRPRWWSIPVLLAVVPVTVVVGFFSAATPLAPILALCPLAILAVLLWLVDRLAPEPAAARMHAWLWGATVAVAIPLVLGLVIQVTAPMSEGFAATVFAPLAEEAAKGLGLLLIWRRRQITDASSGIIYAAWIAAGFAVIEDVIYFSAAAGDGALWVTFIIRGIFTPFLHPMFSMWMGLALGIAAARNRRWWWILWGYVIAVALHAAWNGGQVWASRRPSEEQAVMVLLVFFGFAVLFAASAVLVGWLRVADQRRFNRRLAAADPVLGLSAFAPVFGDRRSTMRNRRALPSHARSVFDLLSAAIQRLVMANPHDDQAELIDQIHACQEELRPYSLSTATSHRPLLEDAPTVLGPHPPYRLAVSSAAGQ